MGCCAKQENEGDTYSVEAGTGLTSNRKCTDIIFTILFLAVSGGMIYLVGVSIPTGSIYSLAYGRDSFGNVCNRKNDRIDNVPLSGQDMTGLTKTFYMNPFALVDETQNSTILCVRSCPSKNIMSVAELQSFADVNTNNTELCHYDIEPADYPSQFSIITPPVVNDDKKCPLMPVLEQVDVINVCTPAQVAELASNSIDGAIAAAGSAASIVSPNCARDGSFFTKAWGDIQASADHILYLSLIALGVAFIITVLMGVIATIIIWAMLIIMALGSIGGTAMCWYMWYTKNDKLKNIPNNATPTPEESADVRQWLIIAIIVSVVAFIVLLLLLVMRKRIKLVAQLFVEASKAIRKMPLLLLQPLISFIFLLGALAVIGIGAIYLMTSGEPTLDSEGHVTFVPSELMWYLRWFYLFGTFWWMQFIFACEQMVIAGAVSIWFFTRDKSSLGLPIGKSVRNLLRYHLGTVLFGSFIIALVKLAQAVLAYISRTLHSRNNKVVAFVIKCVACCLWCFEKFLKFVNRNAYIMTAIHGYSFCKAAWSAFQVIIGNALRVAAINSVGAFCLLIGKLGVVSITVYLGFQFFIGPNPELCFFFIPLILVGIISFIIAHCFLGVYSMTIDTIFICFCEDCTHNDGVDKPYFMSKGLMEFVENSGKAEKKEN